MRLKLRCYQLKTGCCKCGMFYVSPIVTTKKIPREDTQKKMKKKSKYVTIKKKSTRHLDSKRY